MQAVNVSAITPIPVHPSSERAHMTNTPLLPNVHTTNTSARRAVPWLAAGLALGLVAATAAHRLSPSANITPHASAATQPTSPIHTNPNNQDKLAIVWTSADPDVAHRMTLMYTHAAQRQAWFSEVTLIIWGPSQRLVAADKDIRAKIQEMIAAGVNVRACRACSDLYGLSTTLEDANISVEYMGIPLSDMLKSGYHVMTF